MVVNGLQTYCEKIEATLSGNLKDLIKKEISNNNKPIVILDESSLTFLITINELQTIIIKKNIENLVKNILSSGANLVVIIRGNFNENIHYWIKKENSNQELNTSINKACEYVEKSLFKTCVITSLYSISNSYYKVFTSIKNVHEEAAEIAASENCVIVIGQDSNYLIYEKIKFFIELKSFNFESLDCSIYDKRKLMDHLGLQSYHLPLFATLCGNDIVRPSYLNNFHKKIKFLDCFLNIAKIIRDISSDPYKHTEDIVTLINHPMVDENLIRKSLDMYLNISKNSPENKWKKFADERKKLGEWSTTLYKIFLLKQFRYCYPTGSLDTLDTGLLSSLESLRPLRKKIYGILFYEVSKDYPFVYEFSLEDIRKKHKGNPIPFPVLPEKPKCEHPGLIQLWEQKSPHMNFLKWNMLCSSIGENLNYFTLRDVPSKVLFPVLALHYLKNKVFLSFHKEIFSKEFQIETFLVVALLVSDDSYDPLQVQKLKPPSQLDSRLAYLIYMFADTCFTLAMLNEACGLIMSQIESCPSNYYDGLLVRYVYEKMKEGTKWVTFFESKPVLKVLFCRLKDIIFQEK